MVVNFITLKWGTKYGPEYVNRLYANLLNAYNGEFEFYCFTDDAKGLHPAIHIRDIKDLRPNPTKCFTIEKIYLFDPNISKLSGPCVLLDLDILIINDLNIYLSNYNFIEGRFIKNYWNGIELGKILSKYGRNWINSSFVTWKEDQLIYILDFYKKHKEVIEFKYGDLDFFLFQAIRDKLNYHPEKIIYSYVDGADENDREQYVYRDNYSIVLFNTSHGRGVELHETTDWSKHIWKRFG
jgi:hypothetical protein